MLTTRLDMSLEEEGGEAQGIRTESREGGEEGRKETAVFRVARPEELK